MLKEHPQEMNKPVINFPFGHSDAHLTLRLHFGTSGASIGLILTTNYQLA
jgi:hypothetical protein